MFESSHLQDRLGEIEFEGDNVGQINFVWGIEERPFSKLIDSSPVDLSLRWVDRFSPLEAIALEWSFAQSLEQGWKIGVDKRSEFLRTIFLEFNRILWGHDYLRKIFCVLQDSFSVQLCDFIIEEIFSFQELVMGARILPQYICLGGVRKDLSIGEIDKFNKLLLVIEKKNEELFQRFSLNKLMQDYLLQGVYLSAEWIRKNEVSGAVAQASGLLLDARINFPMGIYKKNRIKGFSADKFLSSESIGSPLARLLAVQHHNKNSIELIRNFLKNLPNESVCINKDMWLEKLPVEKTASVIAAPSGLLRCEIVNRKCRFKSYSIQLRSLVNDVLQGINRDELELSLLSLGIDFAQGDLWEEEAYV